MDEQEKQKYGLEDIYFIEILKRFQNIIFSEKTEAVIEFEPMYTIKWNKTFAQRVLGKVSKFLNPSVSAIFFILFYGKR